MGLTNRIKRWFAELSEESLPDAVAACVFAYYWEGAAPIPHRVRNLGVKGAEIVTADKWYPGTIIQLTLQCGGQTVGEGGTATQNALPVRSKVVANSPDGVRVEFLYLNQQERAAAGKFLARLRTGSGQ